MRKDVFGGGAYHGKTEDTLLREDEKHTEMPSAPTIAKKNTPETIPESAAETTSETTSETISETAATDSVEERGDEKTRGKKKIGQRLRAFAARIKEDTLILYVAFGRLPLYKKLVPFVFICYAFSPIDLIPDFIPVIGLLDDLLILPIGVWLCRKIVPKKDWEDCKEQVCSGVKIKTAYKIIGAILMTLIWVAVIFGILSSVGVFG